MLIETWVAVLFVILLFIIEIISLLGWVLTDQNLKEVTKENRTLRKENAQLKSKLRLIRLYITLKEYEK